MNKRWMILNCRQKCRLTCPRHDSNPRPQDSQTENYYCTAQLGALVVSELALPEAHVVPGIEFVAGLEKMSDAGEPVPLVQPDARIVGQRDHRDRAMESLLAQAVE